METYHSIVTLESSVQNLIHQAMNATKGSYCPYSHFSVGAALMTETGLIILGANVENASYGLTICAERSALFQAFNRREYDLKRIAITARKWLAQDAYEETTKATAPCGACRQVLHEAASVNGKPIEVILTSSDFQEIIVTNTAELLPSGFGSEDLGVQDYIDSMYRNSLHV
ncbi:cytidine deaminase [Candidatus Woesearchaeota archaeon]|nr:MAG: cytidine deaminase [Candidatus Woesearchaeota archaeon]